jgi:hypothetical protein
MCQVILSETGSSCTTDYSSDSGVFEVACRRAGAQFREINCMFDCKVPVANGLGDADVYFNNTPVCLSQNCTIEEIQEELEFTLFTAAGQVLAQEGFDCNVSSTVVAVSAGTTNLHGTSFVSTLALFASAWTIIEAVW